MKGKSKTLIAAFVIFSVIGVMMVMGITNLSGRAVTIEQVLAPGFEFEDRYLRVEGELLEGYSWNTRDVVLTFDISDGENVLSVVHEGFQPDNFYAGVEVIVEGYYQGDGTFVAESVQTRCPSAYEEEKHGEDPH